MKTHTPSMAKTIVPNKTYDTNSCYDKLSIVAGKQRNTALKKDHNNTDLTIFKCPYSGYIQAYS